MRSDWCVAAALTAALLSSLEAQAQDAPADPSAFVPSLPQTLAGVPGTWDLSRDGSTRRCVLTLSSASGEAGRKLSFPAGCRRALPVLSGISGWLFTGRRGPARRQGRPPGPRLQAPCGWAQLRRRPRYGRELQPRSPPDRRDGSRRSGAEPVRPCDSQVPAIRWRDRRTTDRDSRRRRNPCRASMPSTGSWIGMSAASSCSRGRRPNRVPCASWRAVVTAALPSSTRCCGRPPGAA